MKIIFKQKDEQNINIINKDDGRIIGAIFSPSGTSRDKPNAIQVCGFSRAFEHWGCGTIGDNDGKSLQDIQLLFKDFKWTSGKDMKGLSFGTTNIPIIDKKGCDRCYYWKDNVGNCNCSELKVHRRFENIAKWEKRRKNYENKVNIINKLK